MLASSLACVLVGCGKPAAPVSRGKTTQDWINALAVEDAAMRAEAVKKLGNIGSRDPAALPAAFKALFDPVPAVRREAIFVVVRTWPASRETLPRLKELSEGDEDPEIRKMAAEAYENLSARK